MSENLISLQDTGQIEFHTMYYMRLAIWSNNKYYPGIIYLGISKNICDVIQTI